MPRQAHCWMKRVMELLSLSRLKTARRTLSLCAAGRKGHPGAPSLCRPTAGNRQAGFRSLSGTLSVSDSPCSDPSFDPSGHGGPTRPPDNLLGPGQSREAPNRRSGPQNAGTFHEPSVVIQPRREACDRAAAGALQVYRRPGAGTTPGFPWECAPTFPSPTTTFRPSPHGSSTNRPLPRRDRAANLPLSQRG